MVISMSRLLRSLICLLLICCILANSLLPIKADAAAVFMGLTIAELLGLLAMIIAVPVGAVFIADSMTQVSSVGQEIIDVWIDEDSYAQGRLELAEALCDNINGMWENGDDSDYDPKLNVKLARGLLSACAAYVIASIAAGAMESGQKEEIYAPDGYAYYNGILLPLYTFNYQFALILKDSNDLYHLYLSNDAFEASGSLSFSPDNFIISSNSPSSVFHYTLSNSQWVYSSSSFSDKSGSSWDFIWTNHNVYHMYASSSVFFEGSEPSSTYYEYTPITIPGIYVGDIPAQLEDPDLTDDEKEEILLQPLPDNIDITKILKSPETALQDLTTWQQGVADGSISLDQAVQDITADTGSSGDTPSGSVPDMLPYALDLTDFFPFCIPFDIYDFFAALIAEPEAPKFHWEFQDLSGRTYSIDIDLSPWNGLAATFRSMQLLLFIVGLAVASRKFIKW